MSSKNLPVEKLTDKELMVEACELLSNQSLLFWTQLNLKNEKGQIYEFKNRAYLKDIYNCPAQTMRIKKAAQMGISAYAVNKALWLCDTQTRTVIFTMPTGRDVSDFSQTRVNPSLRKSNLLHKTNIDNVGIKQIGDSFIYLRGAWTEKQALSIPADACFHDELDRSRPDVREMYEERLSASDLALRMDISTPTIPNYGITALFGDTDKREWFVKCPCGKEAILSEANIIDGEFRCLSCKAILDRRNGYWKATAKSDIAGFHISQLMAPWIPAKEILRKKADYKFKRDYYNFVLGEEYAGGEGLVNRADILSCYSKVVETEGRAVVGIDWGDISWAVVRKGNAIIHFQRIEGDTRTHASQVAELMRKFDANGIADFGYGDTKNKALIDKFPNRFWMCVYSNGVLYPKFNNKENKVNVDRTRSLEETLQEIKGKKIKIFPNEQIEEFISHFLNLVEKKVTDKHGVERSVIERSGDDHFVHALNYSGLLGRRQSGGEPNIRVLGSKPGDEQKDTFDDGMGEPDD